jgi:hypothetical protein
MSQPRGVTLPLSLPRRLICDLLHFAQKIPSIPVQRRMHLGPVVAARQAASPRPSWTAIFTKAYGFVTAAYPELRRAYLSFPWPRLYEHPVNVAMLAVERDFRDERAVFFAHVQEPEKRALPEIDAKLRRYKEAPLESVGTFRRLMLVGSLPRPLRRLLWWYGLSASGRMRVRFFGTFGVTTYGGLGASSLHPRGVLTTTLNYGPIDPDGGVDVRIVYDHRVLDGRTVAQALADLERVLKHEIVAELGYYRALDAA